MSQEWNFYRREVGRLLAEGQEGSWLLIKGDDIIGIWDTQEEAEAVALSEVPDAAVPDPSDPQPRATGAYVIEVLAMPRLDFPVSAEGLLVDVVIGLDGDTTVAQIAAGSQSPAPI